MKKYFFETMTRSNKSLFFILDENGKKLSSTFDRKYTKGLQKLVSDTIAFIFGEEIEKIGDYYLIKKADYLTAEQLNTVMNKFKNYEQI